jgi:hypothetical protein
MIGSFMYVIEIKYDNSSVASMSWDILEKNKNSINLRTSLKFQHSG